MIRLYRFKIGKTDTKQNDTQTLIQEAWSLNSSKNKHIAIVIGYPEPTSYYIDFYFQRNDHDLTESDKFYNEMSLLTYDLDNVQLLTQLYTHRPFPEELFCIFLDKCHLAKVSTRSKFISHWLHRSSVCSIPLGNQQPFLDQQSPHERKHACLNLEAPSWRISLQLRRRKNTQKSYQIANYFGGTTDWLWILSKGSCMGFLVHILSFINTWTPQSKTRISVTWKISPWENRNIFFIKQSLNVFK